MRTLHVIDSLRVGGAERMLVELAGAASALGVAPAVCVTRNGLDLADELPADAPVWTLDRRGAWDAPRALGRLAERIRHFQPDLLHVHGRRSARFVALGRFLGAIRAPAVLHDHYGGPWPLTPSARWTLGSMAAYVAASRRQREQAHRAGAPPERSHVIEPALDLRRFEALMGMRENRRELDLADDELFGLCVAGVRREKGVDTLIEALAERPRPAAVIGVVGGVRDPEYARLCRERIAALGLQRRLRFLGERRDLPQLLTAADFAVHPARVESGPLSLIEQLAAALPVVATRVGAVAEVAERAGVPGFVPPDDAAALRRGIDEIVRMSAQERRRRGDLGRAVARRLFSLEQRAHEWVGVYRAAAGGVQ